MRSAPGVRWAWLAGQAVASGAMIVCLQARLLDPLAAGTAHGMVGYDFFSLPRGWLSLRAGHSLYETHRVDYGPYASPYLSHPLPAVLLGGPLSHLRPWTGYHLFVGVSILLMVLTGLFIQANLRSRAAARWVPFLLFWSVPSYLMLWNGQLQVLTLVAFAMLLVGLRQLSERPGAVWICVAGLLLSLLSKPMLLLGVLPLLSLGPPRRAPLVLAAVYLFVSGIFLLPALNPAHAGWPEVAQYLAGTGGLHFHNLTHWLRMLRMTADLPSGDPEYFSLPALLLDGAGLRPSTWLPAAAVVIVGGLSFANLRRASGAARSENALLLAVLAVNFHFLAYTEVFEYHYATLQVATPFLVDLAIAAPGRVRVALAVACASLLSLHLPTAYFFLRDAAPQHLVLLRSLRVGAALALFMSLTAALWLRLARPRRPS